MLNIQTELFRGWIPPNVRDINEWLQYHYSPGASLVFIFSSLAALIWLGISLYYNEKDRRPGISFMRAIWAGLSVFPVASIVLALSLLQQGKEVSGLLLILYVMDGGWLFWIGTAISTPESLKYGIVPGSYYLRHLPFLK